MSLDRDVIHCPPNFPAIAATLRLWPQLILVYYSELKKWPKYGNGVFPPQMVDLGPFF